MAITEAASFCAENCAWTYFQECLHTLRGVECGLQTLESDDSMDFQGRALHKVCDKLEGSPVLNYLEHFSF